MQNTRSLLGRFSGLALFLAALVLVGLLVVLTVNSDDDTAPDNGMTSSDSTGQDEPVAIPDLDSEPQVSQDTTADDTADSGQVAGSQDGLPNTGPEDAILPALGIGWLVWQGSAYVRSRRLLTDTARL